MAVSTSSLATRLKGIFAAVPTPLDERHRVDISALRRIVQHLLEGGVHGFWVLGAGGEFAALRDSDRQCVIAAVVEVVAGRRPVLAGTGAAGMLLACEAAEQAAHLGADGVFAMAPYFYACGDNELVAHFRAIADSSNLPVLLYNNPHNTPTGLSIDLCATLAGDSRFVGVKDSSTDWDHFTRLLRTVPRDGRFAVLQGDETALATGLEHGADGAVLALPVIAPRVCVELYDAAMRGDSAAARELQTAMIGLLPIYSATGRSADSAFLAGQKAALELLKLSSRRICPPYRSPDEAEMQYVASILRRYNLIGATAA